MEKIIFAIGYPQAETSISAVMKKTLLLFGVMMGLNMASIFAQAPPAPAQQPVKRQIENVGPNINSEYDELYPVLSADGKTLYFVRENSPQNVGGVVEGRINQDIWFSKLSKDGSWQPAENFTFFNDEGSNFVSSVTPDGNTLLIGSKISYRTRQGWSAPVAMDITDFSHKGKYVSYYLTTDGQTLLISMERDDSKGMSDLYVSFLQSNGTWTRPTSLGGVVNSFGNEYAPFLAADGKTLYFSSDGHKGNIGGSDIYYTKRLDGSWKSWSAPVNLGTAINTKGHDVYFTIPACSDWAYMTSTEASLGRNDIYRLPIPAGLKPEPVMLLTGTIADETGSEILEAKIQYKSLTTGKLIGIATTNPATGDYTIVLPIGEKYKIVSIAPNYLNDESLEIDLTGVSVCQTKTYTHKMKFVPTMVMGKVVNGGNNAPLPAKMSIKPAGGGTPITVNVTATGEYKFELPGMYKGCDFTVEATGFNTINENFSIPADKLHGEVRKDFSMRASAIALSGRILSAETKQPVGKATIKYKSSTNSDLKTVEVPVSSEFKIDIPAEAASYELNVEAYGFYPATDKFNATTDQLEIKREILMNARPPLLIYGKISNEKTRDPLPGSKIKSENKADKKVIGVNETNASGDYRIELTEVTDYNLVIKKDGFISIYPSVLLKSNEKYQEIKLDTSLIPIEIGTTVRLNNIQFETAKATLLEESFLELDRLVSLMEDASKLVIEIAGHTDNVGGDDYNLDLSNKRAASVREYLLSKGVTPDRIQSKGYGKTKPLVDNKTEKNRAINRRVEFRVLKID